MRQTLGRHGDFRGSGTGKTAPETNAGVGLSASSLPVRTGSNDARWRRQLAQKGGKCWRGGRHGWVHETTRHKDPRMHYLTLRAWREAWMTADAVSTCHSRIDPLRKFR